MSIAENPTTPYRIHDGPWNVIDVTKDEAFASSRRMLADTIHDTHIAGIHRVASEYMAEEAGSDNNQVPDATILRPVRIPRAANSMDWPQPKHVMEIGATRIARRLGRKVLTEVVVRQPATVLSENLYALVRGEMPDAETLANQTTNEPLADVMAFCAKENAAFAYPTGLAFITISGLSVAIGNRTDQLTTGLTRLRPISVGYFDLSKGEQVSYTLPMLPRLRGARRAMTTVSSAVELSVTRNTEIDEPYL